MEDLKNKYEASEATTHLYKDLKETDLKNATAEENLNKAKKAAAEQAVIDNVKDSMVIGVGSGTTVIHAVAKIGQLVQEGKLKGIKCVPSSYQARQLILGAGLELSSLDQDPVLDLCIDGADEVDIDLNLIKGGGGCLVQEKIVAANAKKFVVIADCRKDSQCLGENWKKGIPVEVIPVAMTTVQARLQTVYGDCKAVLRMSKDIMGPARTENGNFILDWYAPLLGSLSADWSGVYKLVKCIPGVVDIGLFLGMAQWVYFGQQDGTVRIKPQHDVTH